MAAAAPRIRVIVGLLSSIGALIAAVGLRARREWARQGFIAVLGYGSVVGLYTALTLPAANMQDLPTLHGAATPAFTSAQLAAAKSFVHAAAILFAAVTAAINALIILKLCSKNVRREFDAESAA